MRDAIATLNAGFSSVKFTLCATPGAGDPDTGLESLAEGQIDGIGNAPHRIIRDGKGAVTVDRPPQPEGSENTGRGLKDRRIDPLRMKDRPVAGG